ncbi:hypothetical protein ZWY2020_008545 [Hordeum vulgare]|nr:hypothetical protein ZWY2020_008545 [Hordeum vulgare]
MMLVKLISLICTLKNHSSTSEKEFFNTGIFEGIYGRQQNEALLSISIFQKDLLHTKVMAWAFGTMPASVCMLSLHLYCCCKERCQQCIAIASISWRCRELLLLHVNWFVQIDSPTLQPMQLRPRPLDQLTTQPVTLSYVTVLIHSTELLELWNNQIPILLQRPCRRDSQTATAALSL